MSHHRKRTPTVALTLLALAATLLALAITLH